MKNAFKKWMAAVITIAIIAATLGGCAGQEQQEPEKQQEPQKQQVQQEQQEQVKTAEPVKAEPEAKPDDTGIRIGVLNGPTGVGAVEIMDRSDKGEYAQYKFSLMTEGSDIAAKLMNGDLDIGAMPTNLAANLYNKSKGQVKIIAINCLGVLYILENGDSVKTVGDLKGKTIYANGQGANPEYVLNFILRSAGLEPGRDVEVIFREPAEISALMIKGEAQICMLPVPAATAVCIKNQDVRMALDLTDEYAAASSDGSSLTMGCLAVRSSFAEEHPQAVAQFLDRYSECIGAALADIDSSAELATAYGITPSAAIAKKAIPDCSIVCITGKDMKPVLDGYYKVLFDAQPASIGGSIPDEDFYYVR